MNHHLLSALSSVLSSVLSNALSSALSSAGRSQLKLSLTIVTTQIALMTSVTVSSLSPSSALASPTGVQAGASHDEPQSGERDDSAQALFNLHTAFRLVRYGYRHDDVLALTTAARMIKRASLKRSTAPRVAGGDHGKRGDDRYTVGALLRHARGLAAGRSELLNLITDVERSGFRGSMSGLSRAVHVVSPHMRDVFKVKFKRGELAAVLFSGDGDTNLDLYVYDAQNKLVCSDSGPTDECLCSWRPKESGVYTIHVKNLGDAVNRYVIAHN